MNTDVIAWFNASADDAGIIRADPRCAADRLFCYGFNNCHHHANCFADQTPVARVVLCGTDGSPYGNHAIDLIPRPALDGCSDGWCLVEPQNGTTCCFSTPAQPNGGSPTCSDATDVDLLSGEALECMKNMCTNEFHPATCRLLSPGERAWTIQQALAACQANPTNTQECQTCCDRAGQELLEEMNSWCKDDSDPETDDRACVIEEVAGCKTSCPHVPFQFTGPIYAQ
jgi:hypothetical protein